jgi:pyruvate/2-oxoglutarate dehydrogenase complex dihydrolipoamide dehydrogenase (E3) component
LEGSGHFIAQKKVAVNGIELAADHIFINVGTRAAIPPIPGLSQISQTVADFLKEEGIDMRVGSKVVRVEKQGNSISVRVAARFLR